MINYFFFGSFFSLEFTRAHTDMLCNLQTKTCMHIRFIYSAYMYSVLLPKTKCKRKIKNSHICGFKWTSYASTLQAQEKHTLHTIYRSRNTESEIKKNSFSNLPKIRIVKLVWKYISRGNAIS